MNKKIKKITTSLVFSVFSAIVGLKIIQGILLILKQLGFSLKIDVAIFVISSLFVCACLGLIAGYRWFGEIKVVHNVVMILVIFLVLINDLYYSFFWLLFSLF